MASTDASIPAPSTLPSTGPRASYPPLPQATITNPDQIGAALRDPERAGDAVVSLLAILGVGIEGGDGSVIRAVDGPPIQLLDAEVHGLIAMAREDAEAIAAGEEPATISGFHASIAELLPELTLADLVSAYARAYAAAPGAVLPRALGHVAFEANAVITRAEGWFLLVDGFVAPVLSTAGATASIGPVAGIHPGAYTPGISLPFVPSLDPRLSIYEWSQLLGHLPALAYMVPIRIAPSSTSIHEGHGGPGPSVEFVATYPFSYQPLISMNGQVLLLPNVGTLDGLPVTWNAEDASVLAAHGAVVGQLGAPVMTDLGGQVRIGYQTREEPGDQSGPLASEAVVVIASVSFLELLKKSYQIHPATWHLIQGERRDFAALTVEWHEPPGWMIDQASGGGRIHGRKCGGVDGEWVIDGTYDRAGFAGVQQWVVDIDGTTGQGTFTYTDHQESSVGGVTIYLDGRAQGTASVVIDADGQALMHLSETDHTYTSTTSEGGTGSDVDAPLATFDLRWPLSASC